MRLRNGADISAALVTATMAALEDVREAHGAEGLKMALRVAKGVSPVGLTLERYGLVAKGKMTPATREIVEAAVTDAGILIHPVTGKPWK